METSGISEEELERFRRHTVSSDETHVADWYVTRLKKDRKTTGQLQMLLLSDQSLYIVKLLKVNAHKKFLSLHHKYNLMEITTIQKGYVPEDENVPGLKDVEECQPGKTYAMLLCTDESTFKFYTAPFPSEDDELRKARMEIIASSIKATQREAERLAAKPHKLTPSNSSSALPLPSSSNVQTQSQPSASSSSSPMGFTMIPSTSTSTTTQSASSSTTTSPAVATKNFPSRTASVNSPATISPSSVSPVQTVEEGGQPFIYTAKSRYFDGSAIERQIDGILTITPKRIVFEPSSLELLEADFVDETPPLEDSLTLYINEIADCSILPDDSDIVIKTKFNGAKIIRVMLSKIHYFVLSEQRAEHVKNLVNRWYVAAQDEKMKEGLTNSALEGIDSSTSIFSGDSDLVSSAEMCTLQAMMPPRDHYTQWEMVYSTSRNGISLNTLYARARNRFPSVVVVQDVNHHVFGAYVTEEWHKTEKTTHYGSGESFLFKLVPDLRVYRWTKLNDYFQLSTKDCFAVGGGFTGFGLWIDAEFDQGHSGKCDTFHNEPLASSEDFRVNQVELWAPVAAKTNKSRRR